MNKIFMKGELKAPPSAKKDNKIKEDGTAIDILNSCFVLIFAFATVLMLIAYSKTVEIKLEADMIAKNYLYSMENQGYMDDDMKKAIKDKFLENNITCTVIEKSTSENDKYTTREQVAYGQQVELFVKLEFANPIYETFKENTVFHYFAPDKLHYELDYTTTSKW